jgi:hypothetical protein
MSKRRDGDKWGHRPNTRAGYYSSAVAQGLTQYKVDLRPDTLAAWKEAAARDLVLPVRRQHRIFAAAVKAP